MSRPDYIRLVSLCRHDNTGKLQPGSVAASVVHRQWIGLSVQGDQVSVDPLPPPPHPSAPSYLQSIDIEIGFHKKGLENSEPFSTDDMIRHFLKAFNGIVMSSDELILFEYHGQMIKGFVKDVSLLELAEEQRRNVPQDQRTANHSRQYMGIIMDKTDVTFMKASDSLIKLKGSAKK